MSVANIITNAKVCIQNILFLSLSAFLTHRMLLEWTTIFSKKKKFNGKFILWSQWFFSFVWLWMCLFIQLLCYCNTTHTHTNKFLFLRMQKRKTKEPHATLKFQNQQPSQIILRIIIFLGCCVFYVLFFKFSYSVLVWFRFGSPFSCV